jgi:hypothetical protein
MIASTWFVIVIDNGRGRKSRRGRWSMACTTEGCTVRLELPRNDQAVAASASLPAPSLPE